MKLRTTHNSIRIRIRKSELEALQQHGTVEERLTFPNGLVFKFALSIDDDISAVNAIMKNNKLVISLSQEISAQWMNTSQVGIESYLKAPDNEQLHVLIEKDFPCLDRPNEDKSDTFWGLASDNPDAC